MTSPSDRKIRIYYECLEQATELIVPLLKRAFAKNQTELPIELVRANWTGHSQKGPIFTFLRFNSPDLLITVVAESVHGSKEFPLLAVEISEAVKTEDHELQRATVPVAGHWSGIPVLKLSGEKTTTAGHGGNVDFDPHVLAKLLFDQIGCKRYFYQAWPSTGGVLDRHETALCCPTTDGVPLLQALLESLVAIAKDTMLTQGSSREAGERMVQNADFKPAVKAYREAVRLAIPNAGSMVASVLSPAHARIDPEVFVQRRVIVGDDDTLYVKINRFDHAADPDRGILVGLSSIWSKSVLALYQIRNSGKTKNKQKLATIYQKASTVVDVFAGYAAAEGMQTWFVNMIRSRAKVNRWVDCTASIGTHASTWDNNKVLATMFSYADGILVQLDRSQVHWLGLRWDRSALRSRIVDKIISWQSDVAQPPRTIRLADTPNEDEVTWVTVHRVLRPNDFKILCASYPGHQGSGAILDSCEGGRTRSRTYADITAIAPHSESLPSLTEAKDDIKSGIDKDIEKLLSFRFNPDLRAGLANLLEAHGFQNWDREKLLLSIAFGSAVATTWKPDNIDFLVILRGRERFQVAPFGDNRKYFKIVEGSTELPVTYVQV